MSPCHDMYDQVAPVSRHRPVAPALTQCHDEYPAPVSRDEDEKAPEADRERRPHYV
ncbi:MAG TPA: hypothetical protein VLX59_09135 [Acidimicrobiales bacterium]|nr:hypothetical protein [Acidimicrobiales bacterium]